MKKLLLSGFLSFLLFGISQAQPLNIGAWYSFDNCDAVDDSGNGSDGVTFGSPTCTCGIFGDAMQFDGIDDNLVFFGVINNYFSNANFGISFYMRPDDVFSSQSLFSKRDQCNNSNVFTSRVNTSQGELVAQLSESNSSFISVTADLEPGCWYHVVINRDGTDMEIYIDGLLVATELGTSTMDVTNAGVLSFSDDPCIGLGGGLNRFKGALDEVYIFSRALVQEEVNSLYRPTNQILNRDTTIFLGDQVDINLSQTCANSFSWNPTDFVSDPSISNPILSPDTTTTYTLSITDDEGCSQLDTIQVIVIDPALLDCEKVFLPTAFTPDGDNLNDAFFISNPVVVEDLESFEIFDRWGSRVFYTNNPFETWDGTFHNQELNTGTYLYRVIYSCQGEEFKKIGEVTLMR